MHLERRNSLSHPQLIRIDKYRLTHTSLLPLSLFLSRMHIRYGSLQDRHLASHVSNARDHLKPREVPNHGKHRTQLSTVDILASVHIYTSRVWSHRSFTGIRGFGE